MKFKAFLEINIIKGLLHVIYLFIKMEYRCRLLVLKGITEKNIIYK